MQQPTTEQEIREIINPNADDPHLPRQSHEAMQDSNPRLLFSLRRYVLFGEKPGGFLCAVIENDLFKAVGYADPTSQDLLPDIVEYLSNYPPSNSHGSVERRRKWQARGGMTEGRDDRELGEALVRRNL